MKIIEPSATLLDRGVNPLTFIEKVGRTCYKSEDKITETSAETFVKGLVKRQHFAMLEHWWVHIAYFGKPSVLHSDFYLFTSGINPFFKDVNAFRFMHLTNFGNLFYDFGKWGVGGNLMLFSAPLRVFLEIDNIISERFDYRQIPNSIYCMMSAVSKEFPLFKGDYSAYNKAKSDFVLISNETLEDMLRTKKSVTSERGQQFVKELAMEHTVHSVHFVCDRGVSHEIVRHRPCSFAQESTRYCNYSNEKFGSEITVIRPFFFSEKFEEYKYHTWLQTCEYSETQYFKLLESGASPQEARSVLPNSLKTEIVVTANETEWQHIINLRYLGTTGSPHPQMKQVMCLVVNDLVAASGGRLKC